MARLEETISAKVSREVFAKLQAEGKVNNLTISEVVRRIIDQHFEDQSARMGAYAVEEVIRRVFEPHVDQLATLIAHAGIAAGTAAWLNKALANLLTDVDSSYAWDQAVARAKASLRRSMQDNEDEDD